MGRASILRVSLFILVFVSLTAGRCEEATERELCEDLSEKLCDKWFDCWPMISGEIWDNLGSCETRVQANCANSDVLYDCDISTSDLQECNDDVDGSACGSLPASCTAFINCSEGT